MKKSAKQDPRNRIWIELDKAPEKATDEERVAFMHAQCTLANEMMKKLGNMYGRKFFVMTHKGRTFYCFGGNMGFKELVDRGEWFSLDYIAKSKRQQRAIEKGN